MPFESPIPVGETVTVTMEGAAVIGNTPLTVDMNGEQVVVPAGDHVTVTVSNPASWPPQAGDVWNDKEGEPWFALWAKPGNATVYEVRMVAHTGGGSIGINAFKQQNRPVVLVRRASVPQTPPAG
jgi:hypothetical protein